MILPNVWISSTRGYNGVPIIAAIPGTFPRFVQMDDGTVSDDSGMVEIMPGSSSAMAPTLSKTFYDWPVPGQLLYQRNDVITVLGGTGQSSPVIANPFYVLQVLAPFDPLAAVEVRAARMDMLTETALWLQRIKITMPGANRTPGWDPERKQVFTDSDGSFGIGVHAPDPVTGQDRWGYFAGRPFIVGLNEYAQDLQQKIEGEIVSEMPVLVYEPIGPAPIDLSKGDLIVMPNGRRLIVADTLHRFQRKAVIMATLVRVEERQPGDITFSVPLT